MRITMILVTATLAVSGCSSKKQEPSATGSGSASSPVVVGSAGSGSAVVTDSGSASGSAAAGSAAAPPVGITLVVKDFSKSGLDALLKTAADAQVAKLTNPTGQAFELLFVLKKLDVTDKDVNCNLGITILTAKDKTMVASMNGGAKVEGAADPKQLRETDCIGAVAADLFPKVSKFLADKAAEATAAGPRPATVTEDMVKRADQIVTTFEKIEASITAAGGDCKKATAAITAHTGEVKALADSAGKFREQTAKDPAIKAWFEQSYAPRMIKSMQAFSGIAATCKDDKDFTAAMKAFPKMTK